MLARRARDRLDAVRAGLARDELARRTAAWSVVDTLAVLRARGVRAAAGARTYRDGGGVVRAVPLVSVLATHRELQRRAIAAPSTVRRPS